jgi:hypothetical protein
MMRHSATTPNESVTRWFSFTRETGNASPGVTARDAANLIQRVELARAFGRQQARLKSRAEPEITQGAE